MSSEAEIAREKRRQKILQGGSSRLSAITKTASSNDAGTLPTTTTSPKTESGEDSATSTSSTTATTTNDSSSSVSPSVDELNTGLRQRIVVATSSEANDDDEMLDEQYNLFQQQQLLMHLQQQQQQQPHRATTKTQHHEQRRLPNMFAGMEGEVIGESLREPTQIPSSTATATAWFDWRLMLKSIVVVLVAALLAVAVSPVHIANRYVFFVWALVEVALRFAVQTSPTDGRPGSPLLSAIPGLRESGVIDITQNITNAYYGVFTVGRRFVRVIRFFLL